MFQLLADCYGHFLNTGGSNCMGKMFGQTGDKFQTTNFGQKHLKTIQSTEEKNTYSTVSSAESAHIRINRLVDRSSAQMRFIHTKRVCV